MVRSVLSSAACAVAFTFAGIGSSSAYTIDTFKSWDGSLFVEPFGCPSTTNYGQTFIAPKKSTMTKFTFWMANLRDNPGKMVVRGEIYAWDGEKAIGAPLWESNPRAISYKDSDFHAETFKTGLLPLTPGVAYIMFATIDKDYAKCKNNYALEWADMDDSVYPGGGMYYQDNAGDPAQWTMKPWVQRGNDLAFIAYFK